MTTVAEVFESMAWGPAPEAAEPAFAWLSRHKHAFGHFIDGSFVSGSSSFATVNPANRQKLADIAQGTASDVDAAVLAARGAFSSWSALPGHVRARYLYALAR